MISLWLLQLSHSLAHSEDNHTVWAQTSLLSSSAEDCGRQRLTDWYLSLKSCNLSCNSGTGVGTPSQSPLLCTINWGRGKRFCGVKLCEVVPSWLPCSLYANALWEDSFIALQTSSFKLGKMWELLDKNFRIWQQYGLYSWCNLGESLTVLKWSWTESFFFKSKLMWKDQSLFKF